MLHDDATHLVEILPEHLHEQFWRHTLRDRCEVGDVAEEYRDVSLRHAQPRLLPALEQHLDDIRVHVPREGAQAIRHVRERVPDRGHLLDHAAHPRRLVRDRLSSAVANSRRRVKHAINVQKIEFRHSAHVPRDELQWASDLARNEHERGRAQYHEGDADDCRQGDGSVEFFLQAVARRLDTLLNENHLLIDLALVDVDVLHTHDNPMQCVGSQSIRHRRIRVDVPGLPVDINPWLFHVGQRGEAFVHAPDSQ
mmetsp:Transcript_89540/g.252304  ORF Transcript_89540/g.252304 Transcript_89540/m.252304 type:complete len:253 (-) Transcript_89540:1312-2070(-)